MYDDDKEEGGRDAQTHARHGEVADQALFVAGFHMPFPALGMVEKAASGHRWVPVGYQLNLLRQQSHLNVMPANASRMRASTSSFTQFSKTWMAGTKPGHDAWCRRSAGRRQRLHALRARSMIRSRAR